MLFRAFNWTGFIIDGYFIDTVKEMEISDKQLTMTNGYPIFQWDPGVAILDND